MEKLVSLYADTKALRNGVAAAGQRIDKHAWATLNSLETQCKDALEFWDEDVVLEAGKKALVAVAAHVVRGDAYVEQDIDAMCEAIAPPKVKGSDLRALQIELDKAGWIKECDRQAALWELDLLFQSCPTRGELREAALRAGLDVPYGPLDTPMRGTDVVLFRNTLEVAMGIKRQPLPKAKPAPIEMVGKGVARGKGKPTYHGKGVWGLQAHPFEGEAILADVPDMPKWNREVVEGLREMRKVEKNRIDGRVAHRVRSMRGKASRKEVEAQARVETYTFLAQSNFLKDFAKDILPTSAAPTAASKVCLHKAGRNKGQPFKIVTDRRGGKTRGVKSHGGKKH